MGFFDAFYVMSYTASTIGFGEIPHPFTYAQRMWVTVAIYLTVIGWAYAIGSLLALLQDRAFRQAVALQHFTRKVSRLREPFLLIAGYGRTGELLGHVVRRARAAVRRHRQLRRADRRPGAGLLPRRRARPGRRRRATPATSAIAGLGHPVLRGRARADRRRRGEPRGHHDRGPAAARRAGDRPDRSRRRSASGCAPSAPRRSSTRSTGSATTCDSPCARRRPTS